MKQRCSVTARYIAMVTFLIALCSQSVFAGADDWFESSTGKYSFVMPEGFSRNTYIEELNQEVFTGTGSENFNIVITENNGIPENMLVLFGDLLIEEVAKQYTELGIPEDSIEKEGLFTTEENSRKWFGILLDAFGMRMHQCITCSNVGELFTLTFTDMHSEDEQLILNSFDTQLIAAPESGSETDPLFSGKEETFADRSQSAQDETIEYTLMDGKMKLEIPDDYNVLIKGETEITDEIASSLGTDKERLDLFLSLQGSNLLAVKKGETLSGGNSGEIHVRIKPDKYEGIDNLADVPELMQTMLAEAMISGFKGGNDEYQFYRTPDACFIVFDFDLNMMGYEARYATIVDEAMIYIYYHVENGEISDQERQMMQDIVDTVRFS